MALGPGSIAFVGMNTNGTDWFAFVAIDAIPAGTVIYFTDNELANSSSTSFNGTASGGETFFKWVAPVGGVVAGTVVNFSNPGTWNGTTNVAPTVNVGTASYLTNFAGSANSGLSNGQDSLYAYTAASDATADTPTAFLTFINVGNLPDPVPATLASNQYISFGSGNDAAYYSGAHTGQPSFAGYLDLINNPANWTQVAAGTANSALDVSAFTVPAAEIQSVGFAAGSLAVSHSEGNSGATDFVFTVERAGGTTGEVSFSGTFAAPATDNADYVGGEPIFFSGTILDGQASGSVTIHVAGDVVLESNENFALTLDTVSNSNVSVTTSLGANVAATGTILDDDTSLGIDLSLYVRVGRFDLPEPTRTTPPDAISLLAQEASGVTYNWDTDTLFITSDGGTSIVQVSKTGELIDSMTLAPGGSPQGTEFYDPEGITYIGNGQFVMTEERDRQVVQFTYEAGTTLERDETQTVALGTFVGNEGFEGLSYDPATGGFIIVKETNPESIFQTTIDFENGTASNGSPTATGSTNLFNPALAGLADFADVFALSNLTSLIGNPDSDHLLILSQESGKILEVGRDGTIYSALTFVSDPGNPLSIVNQQHEGLTMDSDGFLYIVSENGGGDFDHPQLWVYARSSETNLAPTAAALNNQVTAINENTPTTLRIKVADVAVTDDGLGTNNPSLSGVDTAYFEVDSTGLYIKAGTVLDFETKSSYAVTVNVDDVSVGSTPDATVNYTLLVNDIVNENPGLPSLYISEVAPWSSGNSPVAADWFEVTNGGSSAIDITGWKVDDNSNFFSSALALNGVTSIAAGQSVIFFETADLNATTTTFINTWFGGVAPAGLQFGSYSGGGVGLSTGGDAVNLYSGAGVLQASVNFGASPSGPFATFNNAAGINNGTISQLSAIRQNGAFSVTPATPTPHTEIGSPGSVGRLFVSEVAPWASGNSPGAADWFELTNSTTQTIDITGWKMDDNSGSAAAAVALNGITSIAPGETVVFIETGILSAAKASFLNTWFGGNAPAGLQFGSYTGSGVGLSTTADAVNIYNSSNVLQASLAFGASPGGPAVATFDNATGLNGVTISQLSANGVNAAFVAVNDANETGSPGEIVPVNDAPTAGDDSLTSVAEDSGARTISFASLIANDLKGPATESGQTLTITGVSNAVGGSVSIVGTDVIFTPTENYNGPASFEYTVRDNGTSYGVNDFKNDLGSVTFTITPINDAPQITSGNAFSVDEGNTPVGTVTATDVEANAISFSITGGEDQGFFAIDPNTGALSFIVAPDYEALADFDHDNAYEVVVTATDSLGAPTNQAITVQVADTPGVTINGTNAANLIDATHAPAGQPFPTNYDDTINGKGGIDTISGLAGDDFLDGGAGADTMTGGLGNDIFVVSAGADDVVENPDEGVDEVRSSVAYTLAANVENLVLSGSANLKGTGNADANAITGNSGDNTLAGLEGADTLDGGQGLDTATYAASASGVNVSLTTGANTGGDAQGDTLTRIENVTGSQLTDIIEGDGGDNVLAGGGGKDTVSYEHAVAGVTVSLAVTAEQDTTGAGLDTLKAFENLTGSGHADILTGSSAANVIDGLDGGDLLNGGGGIDTLFGGDGADTLVGGAGKDVLTGGADADIFLFGPAQASSADKLMDFQHGLDVLQFSATDYGLPVGPLDPGNLVFGTAATDNHSEFLYNAATLTLRWDPDGIGGTGPITIATFDTTITLTASDFVVV